MNTLKQLSMAAVATTAVTLALIQMESVRAATIRFQSSAIASDNTGSNVLITLPSPSGSIDFFAFNNLDSGSGFATAISGFSSLDRVTPNNLTFRFGDLELVNFFDVPNQTSTQQFADNDGNPPFFELFENNNRIATGTDLQLNVVTNKNPSSPFFGTGTGFGRVKLTGLVGNPFFEEVNALTDGTGIFNITLGSFIPTAPLGTGQSPNAMATFQSSGTITPVPFEFSPGLGILALGAWGAIAQLKSKVQKHKFLNDL